MASRREEEKEGRSLVREGGGLVYQSIEGGGRGSGWN